MQNVLELIKRDSQPEKGVLSLISDASKLPKIGITPTPEPRELPELFTPEEKPSILDKIKGTVSQLPEALKLMPGVREVFPPEKMEVPEPERTEKEPSLLSKIAELHPLGALGITVPRKIRELKEPTKEIARPVEIVKPEKVGIPQIAKETLLGGLKGLTGMAKGGVEAGMALGTGVPAFLAGTAGQLLETVYDLWKSGFRDIETPDPSVLFPMLLKKTGEAKTVREFIESATYQPETEEGKLITGIITSPFEAYYKVVDEVSDLTTNNPETKAGIKYLADIGLIFGLPLIKTYFKNAKLKPKPIEISEIEAFKAETLRSEKVPSDVKQEISKKFRFGEEVVEKRKGAPVPKTPEEIALETIEQRGEYLPRARPEYKEPPKLKKEYPPEYIAKQNKIIETEGAILKGTKKPQKQIAEFIENEFMDGERLRTITNEVIEGKRTEASAIKEVKELIEDTIGKPEPIKVAKKKPPTAEETLKKMGLLEEKKPKVKEVPGERVLRMKKEIEKRIKVKEEKPKPEIDLSGKKVKVEIQPPYGAKELREMTADKAQELKDYAKKLGISDKVKIGEPFKGEWKQYLPASEELKSIKDFMREVKETPAEKWKEYELYAGYPFTKEVARTLSKIKEKREIGKEVKLGKLKQELQKTDEGKVEWMYLETDRLLKEKRKPSFKKALEEAKHALVDTSGNVKKKLIKDLGELGKEAAIRKDLKAGAQGKAEAIVNRANKDIYSGLSKAEVAQLDKVIQSRRTVAISKYKPDVRHPLGLTDKEHAAFLKKIPEEINKKADLYFKEMEKVLDELKSEGLIDKKAYDDLKSKGDYSPRRFIQYIDPETTYTIGGKKITVPSSGIKALDSGSYNVMETNSRLLLSDVVSRTQSRIFSNRANKAAYNLAKEMPDNGIFRLAKLKKISKTQAQKALEKMEIGVPKEGRPIYEEAPAGHTKIKAMVDGKVKEMIMPDEFAKEWITRDPLINEQMANIIGWASGSKILKPMATGLNPGFALTNFPRDIAHVYLVTSEYSSFPGKFTLQIARDFLSTAKDTFLRKGDWLDYIDEGGGMTFLTHQGRPFKTTNRAIKNIQQVLGYLGETSEIWTRLALRKRAIRNGKLPHEATWEARNYLDFSQGGNVAKALDTGIPYLNAGIQGTRGIFRALADRPIQTLWKFANLGAMATGLYLANHYAHRENYGRVTDREKVNSFVIMTPYKFTDKNGNERCLYFKIAKDQGQRVICSIFENLMKKAMGDEVNADQITQSIQDFLPLIPSQNLPPSLDAMMGYFANKDFWTNKDIWRGEKVPPREEYTEYTHPALVKAGAVTGLSPEKLDYALGQFFTRGNIYTSLVSGGLSKIMADQPDKDKRKTITEIVTRLPIIRRVARVTPPYSEQELKEIEKAKIEEAGRKLKQKRELREMANTYYQKLKDEGVKDAPLLKEIKGFIKKQPKEDRLRLTTWFKRYGLIYKVPDKVWWLNLAEMSPEARAHIFWTKYLESDEDERKELVKLARTIPGIWSDRFIKRFKTLRAKWRKMNE